MPSAYLTAFLVTGRRRDSSRFDTIIFLPGPKSKGVDMPDSGNLWKNVLPAKNFKRVHSLPNCIWKRGVFAPTKPTTISRTERLTVGQAGMKPWSAKGISCREAKNWTPGWTPNPPFPNSSNYTGTNELLTQNQRTIRNLSVEKWAGFLWFKSCSISFYLTTWQQDRRILYSCRCLHSAVIGNIWRAKTNSQLLCLI